jgi:cysteine desulfurase
MGIVYMDYAATTPTDPRVVEAMQPFHLSTYGNPSSLHAPGQEAKRAVEEARSLIAAFIGASSEEIVFTSGGTESNNAALKGVAFAMRDRGNHIITSKIEHHSILEPCHFLEEEGFDVTYLEVDGDGIVEPTDVERAVTNRTILISVMHANNEIGTIEPIAQIGRIARGKGVYFHTDGVQTFGRLPLDVGELNIDLLSASGHKFYGPKGVGILYVRQGTRFRSILQGGDQERGRRASTHNVPAIVGMARAVELARESMAAESSRLTVLRDRLITGMFNRIDHIRLNGHPLKRLPNNVHVSIEHVDGEALLLNLDMEGVACATGSACSSTNLEPSHVLRAIGISNDVARGSLRFTLGKYTTEQDIDHLLSILPQIVKRLRAMYAAYGGRSSKDS